VAEHAGGRSRVQQLHGVDAVPPATMECTNVSSRAGAGRAGAVTEVDHLVGGLLDPQHSASVAGSNNPAEATERWSSKAMSTWSTTSEDGLEKCPPAQGS
jgi:hypothetical protein